MNELNYSRSISLKCILLGLLLILSQTVQRTVSKASDSQAGSVTSTHQHNEVDNVLSLPPAELNLKLSYDIVAQYELSDASNATSYFQHLVYDYKNLIYYASATNRILQFNKNLSVLNQSVTGPRYDSPECHAGAASSSNDVARQIFNYDGNSQSSSGCSSAEYDSVHETNNFNKILLINYSNNTLIACGSILQGSCFLYDLSAFAGSGTARTKHIPLAIAANDEASSTYAFIGPSKYYNNWQENEDILYVGTTFTNVGDYRHDVPAIASRKLTDLNLAEFSIQQSNINIDVKYRDHFLVNYVYGFNTSEHAYFVLVQKKSHLAEEAGFITRIARICINDPNYDSYTEITLQCYVNETLAPAWHKVNESAPVNVTPKPNKFKFNQSFYSTWPTPNYDNYEYSENGGNYGNHDYDFDMDSSYSTLKNYNIIKDVKLTHAGAHLAQKLNIKPRDLILMTVFAPSKDYLSSETHQNKNGMCVYSLKEINEIFTENIHMCLNGTIKERNLGYISGAILDGKCPAGGSIGNVYNFCSIGLKISGSKSIKKKALVNFWDTSITSITPAHTGQHTLAFCGTEDGKIKKVLLTEPNLGIYDTLTIDPGNEILPDSIISNGHLYVLSKKRLTKVRLEHCARFTNCSACLQSNDPYCGWCSLEKRCTIRQDCTKDTVQQQSRWLSINNGQQCIDFEAIQPDRIQINDTKTKLQLIIRTLPDLPTNKKYQCVFGGNSTTPPIDAVVNELGLICPTPPISLRPKILEKQFDHVAIPLSVRSSETNKDFVSRTLIYYDCTRHTNCNSCLTTKWDCQWCLYDNKCVHNMTQCKYSNVSPQINTIKTVGKCPHFKRSTEPIYLHNKVPKEIRLEVVNLPKPQSQHTGFLCTIDIEGAHMVLPARVEGGKYIVCEKTPYSYESDANEYNATIEVNWNRVHFIDRQTIILYKCQQMGSHKGYADCSLCITREKRYGCSWCNNQCVYNETCASTSAVAHAECPKPRIDSISPLSGPIEGGTLLTIEGSNLGIKELDVANKIFVGTIACKLIKYEISVRVQCLTGPTNGKELNATILIGNQAGYTQSTIKYSYKDIQLYDIYPKLGPLSGGTHLSVIGEHLNIGTNVRVFLDELECAVQDRNSSVTMQRIQCITPPSPNGLRQINRLELLIDGANRSFTCTPEPPETHKCSIYNYTHDPQILQIKPLRSFSSGGRMITVHGTNLHIIQRPEIVVNLLNQQNGHLEYVNKSECNVLNANQMECESPSIEQKFNEYKLIYKQLLEQHREAIAASGGDTKQLAFDYQTGLVASTQSSSAQSATVELATLASVQQPNQYLDNNLLLQSLKLNEPQPQLNLYINFLMDSVEMIHDIHKLTPPFNHASTTTATTDYGVGASGTVTQQQLLLRNTIVYVDDPVYYTFKNFVKLYKGDTLVIEGENLNLACDESDVVVTIGNELCNVTSLAQVQLVCTPPIQQPLPLNNIKSNGYDLGIVKTASNPPRESDDDGAGALTISQIDEEELPLVTVHVGKQLKYNIGYLKYDLLLMKSSGQLKFSHALYGVGVTIFIVIVILVVILIIYRHKTTQAEREYKRIQIQMDTLESNVRLECKQAFAELQTDMTDLTADLENTGIPTLDHIYYIMKVFFPGVQDHPIFNTMPLKMRMNIPRTNYDTAMLQFEQLINNKPFLLVFIDTLEAQKSFNIRDKVNVASLLMIILMNKLEYATDILRALLLRLIDKTMQQPNIKFSHLMLRRTESVVEKMLTNYMAISMYDYLKNYAGESLFLLYKAIKYQIEKGLIDAVTNESRYSLSEDRLLREQIETQPIHIHIVQDDLDEKVSCKVLDHDTISQVKLKILDALFKNTPYSLRPHISEVDVEWRHGRGGHLTLQDFDLTSKVVNGWKRINTLAHYGVRESAVMSLIAKQNEGECGNFNKQIPYYNQQQQSPYFNPIIPTNPNNASGDLGFDSPQFHQQQQTAPLQPPNSLNLINPNSGVSIVSGILHPQQQTQQCRVFHLVKSSTAPIITCGPNGAPTGNGPQYYLDEMSLMRHQQQQGAPIGGNGNHYGLGNCNSLDRTHKKIPEIFLTRLLATKGTIQKFVNDFFHTVLNVSDELPLAVKWLFDLLDEAAHRYGIQDPEIVHAWKSNSLPLRFWVNFIKNPDFIFDINKTVPVDACLNVIAQTFMDACSTTEHRLGKDSPSNKLLFAKDIPQYREMVSNFYEEVARFPQISDDIMSDSMQHLSAQQNLDCIDTIAALKELYIYVTKYRDQILDALDNDTDCKKMHLAHKLENVACTLEGEETSAC